MSEPSRAPLALARKWRPRSFATLVGQDHVVRALTHALSTGRLHHAYLLTGTRGVGKTTIARILAKALNCEVGAPGQRQGPEPCGVCRACTEIDAGCFPDYLELDAASNRGVDEMTQLLENAVYAPVAGRYKVYVIDEVHMLSTHAFNAMLKTLEEPPGHVVFVLATTDPQKVPVTVLSRCLQFNLKNVPPALVASHLASVLDAEGVAHEPSALDAIGRAASGSLRDALSLTDQAIAFGAGRVGAAEVAEMLGTVDRGFVSRILDALVAGDALAALAVADDMAARGLSFPQAASELALLLQRVALAQVGAAGDAGLDPERLAHWAAAIAPADLQVWWQIVLHGARDLPLAPDEHAGFTMLLLRLFAFMPDEGAAAGSPPAGSPGVKAARPPAAGRTTAAMSAAASAVPSAPAAAPASVLASVGASAVAARPVADDAGEAPAADSSAAVAPAASAVAPPPSPARAASPMAELRAALVRSSRPAPPAGPSSPGAVRAPMPMPMPARLARQASLPDATATVTASTVTASTVAALPDRAAPQRPAPAVVVQDQFADAPAVAAPSGSAQVARDPAVSVRPTSEAAPVALDAAWPELAARLPLSGLAREFAMQSELLGLVDGEFRLRVPVRALAEAATVAKVRDALVERFGSSARLAVEIGATTPGATAAAVASQHNAERLQQAQLAIESDPFVRTLLADFGGRIVPGSVRPV